MKTAYELAMERLGGEKQLSTQQKAALEEIDKKYDARVAEAKIRHDAAMKEMHGEAERQKTLDELSTELRRLNERREAEKAEAR